jgi:hypothetical protein
MSKTILCSHPDCVSPLLNGPKNAMYECRICEPKRAFCTEHLTNHEHSHESRSARALRAYRETHPENVVWSPDRGWHDD